MYQFLLKKQHYIPIVEILTNQHLMAKTFPRYYGKDAMIFAYLPRYRDKDATAFAYLPWYRDKNAKCKKGISAIQMEEN